MILETNVAIKCLVDGSSDVVPLAMQWGVQVRPWLELDTLCRRFGLSQFLRCSRQRVGLKTLVARLFNIHNMQTFNWHWNFTEVIVVCLRACM